MSSENNLLPERDQLMDAAIKAAGFPDLREWGVLTPEDWMKVFDLMAKNLPTPPPSEKTIFFGESPEE